MRSAEQRSLQVHSQASCTTFLGTDLSLRSTVYLSLTKDVRPSDRRSLFLHVSLRTPRTQTGGWCAFPARELLVLCNSVMCMGVHVQCIAKAFSFTVSSAIQLAPSGESVSFPLIIATTDFQAVCTLLLPTRKKAGSAAARRPWRSSEARSPS